MASIAFIGLGTMGGAMAAHLAAQGHSMTVYNRTTDRAMRWISRNGGRLAATPRDAAANAEYVITCVGNEEDLRSVILGPTGVIAGAAPGTILIDHTTVSAQIARELSEIATKAGCCFLDAPVSGGQSGAEAGTLSIMIGGAAAVFEQVEPILRAYGQNIIPIGPVGSGQLVKMVNQICIAGIIQSLSEALAFAMRAQLDIEKVIAVISKGAAGSWQLDHRAHSMTEGRFDFGFAVDWMRKDLRICLDEADRLQARLPTTALINQFYAEVQAEGGGRWDNSSLISLLVKMSAPTAEDRFFT